MIKNASRYDEMHLKVMRLVQATPAIVQRDVAKALGMSLGRTNFCIKTLVNQGLLKIENVRSSDNKRSYAYWLTPEGKAEKAAAHAVSAAASVMAPVVFRPTDHAAPEDKVPDARWMKFAMVSLPEQ